MVIEVVCFVLVVTLTIRLFVYMMQALVGEYMNKLSSMLVALRGMCVLDNRSRRDIEAEYQQQVRTRSACS